MVNLGPNQVIHHANWLHRPLENGVFPAPMRAWPQLADALLPDSLGQAPGPGYSGPACLSDLFPRQSPCLLVHLNRTHLPSVSDTDSVLLPASPGLGPHCALFLAPFLPFSAWAKSYSPSRPQHRQHFTEAFSEPIGYWGSHCTALRPTHCSFYDLFIVSVHPHLFENRKDTTLRDCAQLESFLASPPELHF